VGQDYLEGRAGIVNLADVFDTNLLRTMKPDSF
jgi:hypothetical protein